MMKYSILVLGASISISLFIRICCALQTSELHPDTPQDEAWELMDFEAFGEQEMNFLLSGRADDIYEKLLKFVVLHDIPPEQRTAELQHVNEVVDGWMQDLYYRRQNHQNQQVPQFNTGRVSHSQITRGDDYDQELCGPVDPPSMQIPECSGPSCEDSSEDVNVILPVGCQHNGAIMICDDISDIPPLPPTLDWLELKNTEISALPIGAFPNVTIKYIRMSGNDFSYVHPWAFHDVQNLFSLTIIDSQIRFLSYEIYVGLNQTAFLDLQNNKISFEQYLDCPRRDESDIQPVLPQLRMMYLGGNPLKLIPEQMFAGLRHSPLVQLSLDNCYLHTIDPQAFSYLKNMTVLNLSKNSALMPTLGQALSSVEYLKSLFLCKNGLTMDAFPLEALIHLAPRLEVLDLSGNVFDKLKESVLSNFPSLVELYVDDCDILTIDENAFRGLTKLTVFSMKNSRVRYLPPAFPPTLKYLTLTNSHSDVTQTRTNPTSFTNLTKLMYLELEGINLETITATTFAGMTSLQNTLSIQNCNIKNIEAGAFKDLIKIKTLTLDYNPLTRLTAEMFEGLSDSLENLNLQHCNLTFSQSSSDSKGDSLQNFFPPLNALLFLNLTFNKITSLPAAMFHNLPNLQYINLAHNPIQPWNDRLFVQPPETINTTSIPKAPSLSLEAANIHRLTNAMVHDFLIIRNLFISGNEFLCDWFACQFRDGLKNSTSPVMGSESYTCNSIGEGSIAFLNVTDEICDKNQRFMENQEPTTAPGQGRDSAGGRGTVLIAVVTSGAVITSVVIILAYRNRVHLRYFWFVAKYNIMETSLSPRNSQLSTMESTSGYEYDVFISYHREDSKFIEDVFLPEIELQESNVEKATVDFYEGVCEARNEIYTIQKDALNMTRKRFKVCLHERDFEAGVAITDNIVESVDRSKKTMIFVSNNYMESQWCSYEMNLVYHRLVESRRKAFVLVLLEEIPPEKRSKVLNYLMVSKTYLQWPGAGGSEEELATFWKRLRSFLTCE